MGGVGGWGVGGDGVGGVEVRLGRGLKRGGR